MAEALATRREQRIELRGVPLRYWEVGSATAAARDQASTPSSSCAVTSARSWTNWASTGGCLSPSMGGSVAYLSVEASITSPVLLIGGGSTSHVPQDKLAEVAARLQLGRFVTLEGAGHSVHHTRPTEFIALVREFLLDQPK